VVRAGADIDQSIRSFDQCRQNVRCEHIYGEDAGNSRLNLHPSFAIADARIVDYCIKLAELVHLVSNGPRPSDGGKVASDGTTSSGCRRKRVLTSTVIASVQNDLMPLIDQEPGRQKTKAVR